MCASRLIVCKLGRFGELRKVLDRPGPGAATAGATAGPLLAQSLEQPSPLLSDVPKKLKLDLMPEFDVSQPLPSCLSSLDDDSSDPSQTMELDDPFGVFSSSTIDKNLAGNLGFSMAKSPAPVSRYSWL